MARISVAFDAAKNGTRDLVAAPGSGKRIRLVGLVLNGSAADGTFKLIDSTPNDLTGTISVDIDAQNTFILPVCPAGTWWAVCAENTKLQLVLSANMDADGIVVYEIESNLS